MKKNQLEAKLKDKIITVKITATSEEMANKLFDLIETFGLTAFKVDLEREWNKED